MKLKFPFGEKTPEFLVVTGSRMYGYHTNLSDYDYRGVVIVEDPSYLLGIKEFNEQHINCYNDKPSDIVIYSLKTFIKHCLKGAPNIIELLYAREFLNETPQMAKVCELLRNCKSHKWLTSLSGFAQSEFYQAFPDQEKLKPGTTRFISTDKVGYSVKNAAHYIRLMRQGIELMTSGKITYPLPYAQELRDIRDFKVSYKDAFDMCNMYAYQFNLLYNQDILPVKVDDSIIWDYYITVCKDFIKDK